MDFIFFLEHCDVYIIKHKNYFFDYQIIKSDDETLQVKLIHNLEYFAPFSYKIKNGENENIYSLSNEVIINFKFKNIFSDIQILLVCIPIESRILQLYERTISKTKIYHHFLN